MPLPANHRLGPYEIKAVIGFGGMGEVYRAYDSRLQRDVAIKVLRGDGIAISALRNRFEREARSVAALNHPNIVAVYDFGIEASQQYIVSELIEGESLRSLIKGKPVPVRKLVEIASQVAEGLAAAHAAGVVHRDLKPENIMITKDGRAKILDFGLARQAHPVSETKGPVGSDETLVPGATNVENLTDAGSILGTAAYMSPEQALGQNTDFRSDQFSFGLMLYELAAGKQAFAKGSGIEVMAAIVREEPPPLEEKLPPPLRWIIDRCLAKDPQQRYESTRDLFREIKDLRDHLSDAYSSGAAAQVVVDVKKLRWKTPAAIVGISLLSALLTYVLRPAGQNIGDYRYSPFASDASDAVWSPDGKAVAYQGEVNGLDQVFMRSLNSPLAIQLTHEKTDAELVGWSNDQTHVIVLSWSPGTDLYDAPAKLSSVAVFGGELQAIMDTKCITCAMSPDGKVFATFLRNEDRSYSVWVSDPFGAPLRQYLPAPFSSKHTYGRPQLIFSPNGKELLFSRAGDLDRPEMWLLPYPAGGSLPRQLLAGLKAGATPHVGWLPDNRHLVTSLSPDRLSAEHLWILDTGSNHLEPLTNGPHSERYPAVSPDGSRVLYTEYSRTFDVASVSVEDGSASVLVAAGHLEHKPAWAAKQAKLTWVSERSGSPEIWMRNVDGSDRPVVTTQDFAADTTDSFTNPALSPEGDRLIYGRIDTAGVIQLWVSALGGGSPARLTNNPPAVAEFPSNWSPDGKEYVYLQVTNGTVELATIKTSGNAPPTILKRNVDWFLLPDWSPTGQWITYHDSGGAELISPDGKSGKPVGDLKTHYLAFSKDGKKLYGIEYGEGKAPLIEVDLATLKKKVIKELGAEWEPKDDLLPGIRLSLAPDGKSLVYAVSKTHENIWMLEGYRQPGLLERIRDLMHK
jgi:serine/threonine protein kinase